MTTAQCSELTACFCPLQRTTADAESIYSFLTSDGADFLSVPHADPSAEHPVRLRKVYYMPEVKRPAERAAIGIPGVRYGVCEVTTIGCPKGHIAHKRLPHKSCEHCMGGDPRKCPLSFAGQPIMHKLAKCTGRRAAAKSRQSLSATTEQVSCCHQSQIICDTLKM